MMTKPDSPSPTQPGATAIRRSATTDAAGALVSTGLIQGVAFASSVLVAREFGPDGKGLVTIVLLTVGQCALLLGAGLEVSVVHFAAQPGAAIGAVGRSALRAGTGLGLVGGVLVMALLTTVLDDRLTPAVRSNLAWFALMVPLIVVLGIVHSLIRATGRLLEANGLLLAQSSLALIGVTVAVRLDTSPVGPLVAELLALCVATSGSVLLAIRWSLLRRTKQVGVGLRRLVGYGVRGHFGTILQAVNYRLDIFIVAIIVDREAVGTYSVAVALTEAAWFVPNALGTVLLQRAAALSGEEASSLTGAATRITSAILVMSAAGLALVAPAAISVLYGGDFADAYPAILALLPGTWALGIWKNLVNDLSGRGHPEVKSITAVVAVVVTIGGNLVLVPPFGFVGAAAASSVAYASALVLALPVFKRHTGVSPQSLLAPRRADWQLVRRSVASSIGRSRDLLPVARRRR